MYQKEERLKIFKALSQPILVIDKNYTIADANPSACARINLPYEKIIGQACYKLTHHVHKPCWETDKACCPVKLAIENVKPMRVIHEHKYDTRTVIEEIVATPIYGVNGKVEYTIEELRDISELLNAKEVIAYLKNEINTLRGIIPICASCKKIRDDKGFWQNVENYVSSRTEAQFSHSICPECMKIRHPEICRTNPKICQADGD